MAVTGGSIGDRGMRADAAGASIVSPVASIAAARGHRSPAPEHRSTAPEYRLTLAGLRWPEHLDRSSPAGTPSLPPGTASSPARTRPVAAGNAADIVRSHAVAAGNGADTARNLADAAGSGVCVDGKRAFAVPKAASGAGNGPCGGGKAVVAGLRAGFPARPTPHTRITKPGAAMRGLWAGAVQHDPAQAILPRSAPSRFNAEGANAVTLDHDPAQAILPQRTQRAPRIRAYPPSR